MDVSAPRGTRLGEAHTVELQEYLWKLIREEAAVADREVSHV